MDTVAQWGTDCVKVSRAEVWRSGSLGSVRDAGSSLCRRLPTKVIAGKGSPRVSTPALLPPTPCCGV
jgi:hypothetical protein